MKLGTITDYDKVYFIFLIRFDVIVTSFDLFRPLSYLFLD